MEFVRLFDFIRNLSHSDRKRSQYRYGQYENHQDKIHQTVNKSVKHGSSFPSGFVETIVVKVVHGLLHGIEYEPVSPNLDAGAPSDVLDNRVAVILEIVLKNSVSDFFHHF